ncbi:MAG: peroxiredoxin-like family protein [Kiloniellales bacterium]
MSEKPEAGGAMPAVTLKTLAGEEVTTGGAGGWRLVVVYRGKHCPLCKTYLARLEEVKGLYDALDTEILVVSGDPKEKAEFCRKEWDIKLPLAYDLSVEQMRTLGLYVSEPRSPEETDRPFAEPGVFLVNPEGKIQVIDISNAPFARPDLESLSKGLAFIQKNDYPIRGTLA